MSSGVYKVFRDEIVNSTFQDYPTACKAARLKALRDEHSDYTVVNYQDGKNHLMYKVKTHNGLLIYTPLSLSR